jgi:uncharacterized protein YjiS (DUF1127 family)
LAPGIGVLIRRPAKAIGSALNWRLDVGWEQRALAELRRMSDRELADIGLSRSDLTLEGLTIAGSKRAFKQDAVAAEIGEMTKALGTDQHGN